MPDIPASQTVISNALNQLSQLAPSSDIAQKGVEVLTKHLAGNILSLSKTSGLFSRPVLLNNPNINGKIQTDQTHQVKLSGNQQASAPPSLDFYSQASKQSNTEIVLTEKQLQRLLSLPAKQLLISGPLISIGKTAQLPQINATVLAPLPVQPQPSSQPLASTEKTQQTQPLNQLRLSLTEQKPALEITLPIKTAKPFLTGEKVALALVPKGINWQLTITPVANQTNRQVDALSIKQTNVTTIPAPTNPLSTPPLQTSSETPKTPSTSTTKTPTLQVLLTPQQASTLIQAGLKEQPNIKPVSVEIPLKASIQQLNKLNSAQSQDLIQKLQITPIDKLAIQVSHSGEAKLLLQSSQPVASIVLNKEIAQALVPLKLPNQLAVQTIVNAKDNPINPQNNQLPVNQSTQVKVASESTQQLGQKITGRNTELVSSDVKAPLVTQKQPNELANSLLPKTDKTSPNPTVAMADNNKALNPQLTLKEASAQLLNIIREAPLNQSVISADLLNNKSQQSNLVQSLLRIVKANAETPAITLQSIEKALSDPEFFKASTEQSVKQVIEQALQQIKQTLPQGKEQDSSQIRQLLTAPVLGLSASQMVSPMPSQGMMSGLITLLQISLSARLSRNNAGRSEQIAKVLNDFLGSSSVNTKTPITPKALTDLSQLEQKHQLMKEIGRLLSGHQTSKLSNAEQMLQGQDSFYYNLPSALGGNLKDIELLIKREEQFKDQQQASGSSNKTWQLTMKLSVGELGELLTKAKLREHNLELNFYASNDTVKNQVLNFLPLLRRKLDALGIEMSKSHCQLGKIPDTLQQRPYHVFQAKA